MLVFIAPSPSVDVTYVVDEYLPGGAHRPVSVHRRAGGKALNAARSAATMGADVRAVAVLGGYSGEFISAQLPREGVGLRAIRGGEETRSCISIASVAGGGLTEVYELATPVSAGEWGDVLAEVHALLLQQPGWVASSGSLPASLDPAVLAGLARASADGDVPFAVDTHGPALTEAVAVSPALVKVNRAEAIELLGTADGTAAIELATAIQTRSAGLVVVTDGTAGAVATDGDRRWRIPPPERTGAFPVGSGDAFFGGLLAALDAGSDFSEALKQASGCSIANALEPGAGSFDRDTALDIAAGIRLVDC
ncbi:1-phosphofructokinase/tagatose 6-phosphate kinase [Cryobacterium mesophilum]|uniref:Carbohydrate kinase PfkB domain-containing protein n=1 Tax=Terrimesophilobacter mesophilus TaxID=433647 RepID=A0A4R8VC27_9MICO|nr:PfkB family carbohydrate kinase [Terrimesophilobacter mesophilus]MBB5632814.1 1-phosphofructokinase/tagatose 6-phosphate kinase [Terrimesophilobacter mesophilus]TFB79602.1 hypothetical protein E3N84_05810 [Terrimesophilobacter mesophilus]